jgi:tetratricopeptide (TPR) repeat protein
MARYDRIARLQCPDRDAAFSGWLSLRDLEGREREPELGRRARLRYLALRPVHRLLKKGLDGHDGDALRGQIDLVRDELDRLPGDDPERERLEQYLHDIGGRSPGGLIAATLDVGRAAEAGGHLYAAEEFYSTGLDLAREHESLEQVITALRLLGRIHRHREEWDRASTRLRESALSAASHDLPVEWARSMEGLAAVELQSGDADAALATLAEIEDRPAGDRREEVLAIAAAGRCALCLAGDAPEAALEAGWSAIGRLEPTDQTRNRVLLNMGAAFRRLGLHSGAASCYQIVRQWAPWPELRLEAELELAVVAAEAGDAETFEQWRESVLAGLGRADRPLRALVWLGLGRAAILIERPDIARQHLQDAVGTARDLDDADLVRHAEDQLAILDDGRGPARTEAEEPTPAARRIASRILSLETETEQVAAGT